MNLNRSGHELPEKAYYYLCGFENLYLGDSYVLDIKTYPCSLEFILDAVLTEDHPLYHTPFPNEMYCYRKTRITFPDAKKISWIERNNNRYTDANGELDFGNIDVFYEMNGHYHLLGDWGEVDLISAEPVIEYLEKVERLR
ncbi:MAG: hypothetical protein NVSMB56_01440 [Pyrinomonadaceae bacterium]